MTLPEVIVEEVLTVIPKLPACIYPPVPRFTPPPATVSSALNVIVLTKLVKFIDRADDATSMVNEPDVDVNTTESAEVGTAPSTQVLVEL